MEIILNGLTSLDYLTKSNGTYDLTPLSEKFLVKNKPFKKIEKEHGPEFFEKMVVQIFPMSYPCAKAAAEALGAGSSWKNLDIGE